MKKIFWALSWILIGIVTQAQDAKDLLLLMDNVADTTFVLNDDFSTSACGVEWTCASSWSIADGKATTDNVNANQFQNTSAILTAGVVYVLRIDAVTTPWVIPLTPDFSFTFGLFDIGIGTNLLGSYQTQWGGEFGDSTYTYEFTPVAGSNGVTIYSNLSSTGAWSIDKIQIYIKP